MELLADPHRRLRRLSNVAIFGPADSPVIYTDSHGRALNMNQFNALMRRHEDVFDRLTLEACEDMRAKCELVPDWLLKAEKDAWLRSQRRVANG